MPKSKKILFEFFKPISYSLEVTGKDAQLGNLVISGRKVGKPSRRITLHQKNLKIVSVKARKFGKANSVEEIDISRFNKHNNFEELRLHSSSTLYPGNYEIEINYSLAANDTNKLLLKTLSKDSKPSDQLRTILPCIDEPEAWASAKLDVVFKP